MLLAHYFVLFAVTQSQESTASSTTIKILFWVSDTSARRLFHARKSLLRPEMQLNDADLPLTRGRQQTGIWSYSPSDPFSPLAKKTYTNTSLPHYPIFFFSSSLLDQMLQILKVVHIQQSVLWQKKIWEPIIQFMAYWQSIRWAHGVCGRGSAFITEVLRARLSQHRHVKKVRGERGNSGEMHADRTEEGVDILFKLFSVRGVSSAVVGGVAGRSSCHQTD